MWRDACVSINEHISSHSAPWFPSKRPQTLTESVSSPSTRWESSSRVRRLFNKRTFLPCSPYWSIFKTAPPESTKRANQQRQEKILAIKKRHILERLYVVTAIKTPPTEDLCGSNLELLKKYQRNQKKFSEKKTHGKTHYTWVIIVINIKTSALKKIILGLFRIHLINYP